jgi:hypothetical protein
MSSVSRKLVLMGVNKIFNETGVPDETQIDGEGALACPEAQVV